MTEALYLSDSTLAKDTAKVAEIGKDFIILDRTIFYPQGGGQPSDKGVIRSASAELHVKSVEYNGGEIKHIGTFKGVMSAGDSVELEIDQDLRLKHTQWHTAGHLVDLVARDQYPELIPVRGMHGIGKKLFIEYEGKHSLDTDLLTSKLNKLVNTNPTIKTQFVTLEELKKMANWLPAKLPTSKKLRVLSIGESYHIPDGGTQLQTGDVIWPITISSIEYTNNSTLVHYSVTQPDVKKSSNSNHQPTVSVATLDEQIKSTANNLTVQLLSIHSTTDLDTLYITYLGKRGKVNLLMKDLQNFALDDKKKYGPQLNDLKKNIEAKFETKRLELISNKIQPPIDLTIPSSPQPSGRLHPTTVIIREMNEFFRYLGFSIGEGPELEDVEYNFRRLNLPEGHPATDLQDSLFVSEPQYLMRTHTSSVETRILSDYHDKLPLRVVVPGKCYRNETNSATNTSFFYQYQGFVVDRGITIQHLKDTLTKFHQFLFGHDVKLRFRYKYYPEVSPGMGVDMECRFCAGSGCSVCKYRGFIEVLGSGMIHYNTLKACGIDPDQYTGYAFGMGLDRLVMSKYGIKDIRKLYGGELVYT